MGIIYFRQRKYDLAISFFEEMCKRLEKEQWNEVYPRALYYLGASYAKAKQYNQARDLLLKCIAILKPRKHVVWIYIVYTELASMELSRGNYDEAISNYKRAFVASCRAGHLNYAIAFNMAILFSEKQDLLEAHKYFTFVLKMTKNHADEKHWDELYHNYMACLDLAGVERKLGNTEDASRMLNLACGLLLKFSLLKGCEQYYWQQKILLDRKLGNNEAFVESSKRLDSLKKSKDFNLETYRKLMKKEFPEKDA